ncbi:hypothetical protein FrEUN1fDRAFT_5888 [Parafrankia sp. EUN1f]|nr:hypothetical protein FrEUN1fDRAFT_5888 [Parafrankia sp. EUN1f]
MLRREIEATRPTTVLDQLDAQAARPLGVAGLRVLIGAMEPAPTLRMADLVLRVHRELSHRFSELRPFVSPASGAWNAFSRNLEQRHDQPCEPAHPSMPRDGCGSSRDR